MGYNFRLSFDKEGPNMEHRKDIAIVGGGPGGYLAALRAAQLRKSVVLFEEDRVGGTCMNYGCIPTKYLLHQTKILKEVRETKTVTGAGGAALDWAAVQAGRQAVVDRLVKGIEFLLGKGGVEIVKGHARLEDKGRIAVETPEGLRTWTADAVILATGSRASALPFLKPNGAEVVTSTEALAFPEIPKSLLVIGAGAIGLEMGSIYRRLGTDVTILEILPGITPGSDKESATRLERALKKQGLKILTQMNIGTAETVPGLVTLKGTNVKTGAPFEVSAEKVLLAAGRRPNSENLAQQGLLKLDRGGTVEVNERLETGVPGVYAIGDLIGGKLLAHKAFHDAIVAVENAAGFRRVVDYRALPMAVFTDPEFASVGLTQEEAEGKGLKVRSGVFPLQASGRALTMDSLDGMVKILAAEDGRAIGAHIVAPAASEMIHEMALAVAKGITIEEIGGLIHIHPTLSETIGEAALKARNEALHILN
jgi:dihydrolipoamide dehydrogenase